MPASGKRPMWVCGAVIVQSAEQRDEEGIGKC